MPKVGISKVGSFFPDIESFCSCEPVSSIRWSVIVIVLVLAGGRAMQSLPAVRLLTYAHQLGVCLRSQEGHVNQMTEE